MQLNVIKNKNTAVWGTECLVWVNFTKMGQKISRSIHEIKTSAFELIVISPSMLNFEWMQTSSRYVMHGLT